MGAAHGKKKEYSLEHQCMENEKHLNGSGHQRVQLSKVWNLLGLSMTVLIWIIEARVCDLQGSTYTGLQRDHHTHGSPVAQPAYMEGGDDVIKPKKLHNPVKASKSHQELHRELLMNHKRGLGIENKPELQRVLEHRKREQHIRQKKEEEEARRLKSPFEQELLKRQKRLEELEKEQENLEERSENAPEFIKVKENLRRTSILNPEEKDV